MYIISPPSIYPQECGRIEVMLDIQRAGSLGGLGMIGQLTFVGLGMAMGGISCFYAGMVLLGQLTMGQYFGVGMWIPAIGAPFAFARVWFLCKLNAQEKGTLYNELVRNDSAWMKG